MNVVDTPSLMGTLLCCCPHVTPQSHHLLFKGCTVLVQLQSDCSEHRCCLTACAAVDSDKFAIRIT